MEFIIKRNRLSYDTNTTAALVASEKFDGEELQPFLPGLPNHLAELCLFLVPPSLLFSVCRSWRRLIYSSSFPPFLALYALLSQKTSNPRLEDDFDNNESIGLYCYDPIAGSWSQLPPPPLDPPLRHLQIHHPSFLSRSLPIQSVAVAGHLVLLAASTHHLLPALSSPLAFHPGSCRWLLGPPLRHPRRWCAAGSVAGTVYLASGVGSSYRSDVARSVERWDLSSHSVADGCWEPVAPLRDARFSREAIETVAGGGKLFMVNVQGRGVKEGTVYDIENDRWEEMPLGMLAGWTGPAAAGEGRIYVADEITGEVRSYTWGEDRWRVWGAAMESRRGAVAVAAGGGKLCLAASGGGTLVVVDVVRPGRTWAVELPVGKKAIALHVLPRMSLEEI